MSDFEPEDLALEKAIDALEMLPPRELDFAFLATQQARLIDIQRRVLNAMGEKV